jgi:hypothetical protein
MAYVQHKKGRWFFRIVVPEDVRSRFKGQKEITRSLRATSRSHAIRLAAPHIAEWVEKIAQSRAENARETVFTLGHFRVKRSVTSFDLETDDGTLISRHSLDRGLYREVADDWFREHWHLHFEGARSGPFSEREKAERADPAAVREGIAATYSQYRAILPSYPSFAKQCISLLNGNMKFHSNRIDHDTLFPEFKNSRFPLHTEQFQEADLLTETTISGAVKEYFSRAHEVRPKTEQLWRARIGIFQEWLGDDARVTHLTTRQAEDFRKALLSFPVRRPASVRGFNESVAWADETRAKRLTGQTVNSYTNAIRAVLYPACKRLNIRNPFSELSAVKVKPHADTKYLDFTDEEISVIFGKTFCIDGHGRYSEPSDFWIMLGLLLHGGRINEWAQADRDQFSMQKGIFTFTVRGTVKTEASTRSVPLHSTMLKLGFREFCERAPPGRLFTDLKESERGQFAAALSKRCNRAIDRAGVNDQRKVVHSFRHTWITKARSVDIEKQWTDAIAGHEGDGHGVKYGTYPLAIAQKKLERIKFDLDMTHLADVWRKIEFRKKQSAATRGKR